MLSTVDRYKTYYGITDTTQDEKIGIVMEMVSADIESRCNRIFSAADYTLSITGDGTKKLVLPQYPVNTCAIAGITDFTFTPDGVLTREAGWTDTYDVTFNAGYTVIPAELERACIELTAITIDRQGSEGLKTEVVGPLRSDYLLDIPIYLKSILDRHTRMLV